MKIPPKKIQSGLMILAIDPGAKGGFAWYNGTVNCAPMPETEGDVIELLRSLMPISKCVMEQVGGYAGGAGAPGSAMFNFGCGYGLIKGSLMTLGVPLELVRPQKWQKFFSIGPKVKRKTKKGKTVTDNTEWKNRLKSKAQQLFPGVKITLETADALLILKYSTP